MGMNGTGLFGRWCLIVRVSGDGSIMEVQRASIDSVNSNVITLTFPSDLPDCRPHVSGTGSWIDMSKSSAILFGNVCPNTFCQCVGFFNTAGSRQSVLTPEFSLDVWCDVLGVARGYSYCTFWIVFIKKP